MKTLTPFQQLVRNILKLELTAREYRNLARIVKVTKGYNSTPDCVIGLKTNKLPTRARRLVIEAQRTLEASL